MDHSSSSSNDAHALLSQLDRLKTSKGGGAQSSSSALSSLPTPRQLFAIGGILFQTSSSQGSGVSSNDLLFAYQHLVESLPPLYWRHILTTHQKAAHRLAQQQQQTTTTTTTTSATNNKGTISDDDLVAATRAFHGLFTNAPRLCQVAYSKDWVATLSMIYDTMILHQDATSTTTNAVAHKDTVLSTLSSLLLDGLMLPAIKKERRIGSSDGDSSRTSTVEEELLEAIQAIEEHSTDCLGDLQAWQTNKDPFRRTLESEIRKLPRHNDDEDDETRLQQQEYILSMLESARQKESSPSSSASRAAVGINDYGNNPPVRASAAAAAAAASRKPVSAADELERRIHQVKQILPDFGEGFIETALSLHQGNVETTVSILLGDPSTYPSALRVLDRNLPRRRKERAQEEAEQAAEARQLVKERVALEAKQEEARYKALMYVQKQEEAEARAAAELEQGAAATTTMTTVLDEYDDDYDDQYDEIDIKLGGADEGMYDFEQVKLYNQVMRSEEADGSFWQENRNTNRMPNSNSNNNKQRGKQGGDGDEEDGAESSGVKQYRGPDKIKGGRVIGPDGKVVRKPGGSRGKKNAGGGGGAVQGATKPSNNGSNNNGNKETASNKNNNPGGSETNGSSQPQQPNKGKPRTKPKSQNRVSRQRDKKQKAQGTFGAEK